MIETFYDTTFTNTRESTTSATASDVITTVSTFVGFETPVADKAELYLENNIGKEYEIVCDNFIDVKVGDDIFANGIKRNVLGVSNYKDREDDIDSHLVIRVVKN